MLVQDHIWYVTGGASGLGEATARLLHAQGGLVSLWDIDLNRATGLATALNTILPPLPGHITPPVPAVARNNKRRAIAVPLPRAAAFAVDVCDEGAVEAAIRGTDQLWPGLPIGGVINCGGVAMAGKTVGADGEPFDLETFKKVVEINLVGTFNVSRLVASRIIRDRPKPIPKAGEQTPDAGVIINTASAAALEGQMGQVSYAASKAGVLGMGLPMARDLAWFGIRVMTLCPALFETPMTEHMPPRTRQTLLKNAEFPARFGKPVEFAHAVLMIIENEMLNGSYIRLDGATRLGKL
ncbi:unnamed protein product [Tilletia controversa]|uniref:3-hydroxyacyl-CoA dehydrogenase n=3 Tax=Tilletia TaxID=13289 RepID=A0A8X7T0W1_9BASI|nr:hypothetical protein CF336_g506 [Tilletia laevis]KAE8205344.1 hypothetical protein CF328_g560 [Tilletia controversa]KAE8265717.1 hypothetical protein A4X03_0g83 [Tilletia caries]KAE8207818.1 hypothetical protein CF335_g861 [Tilletia laevis]KAE8255906.1 hypothetical protein A4X06_0g192 [Tilletia controversa]